MAEPFPDELEAVHEDAARRMVRALARSPRGALIVAVGRSVAIRAEVLRLVADGLGDPVVEVALSPTEPAPWERVLAADGVAVAVLPEGPAHELLRKLNVGREARVAARKRVIMWVPELGEVDGLREHAPDLWAHRRDVMWLLSGADFAVDVPPFDGETYDEQVARLRRELDAIDPTQDPDARVRAVLRLLAFGAANLPASTVSDLLAEVGRENGNAQTLMQRIAARRHLQRIEDALLDLAEHETAAHHTFRAFLVAQLATTRRAQADGVRLLSMVWQGLPHRPLPSNLANASAFAAGLGAIRLGSLAGARRWQRALQTKSVSDLPRLEQRVVPTHRSLLVAEIAWLEGRPVDAIRAMWRSQSHAAAVRDADGMVMARNALVTATTRVGYPRLAALIMVDGLSDRNGGHALVPADIRHGHALRYLAADPARLTRAMERWLRSSQNRRDLATAEALLVLRRHDEAVALLLDIVETGPGLPATQALERLADLAIEDGDLVAAEHHARGTLPWVLGWAGAPWKIEAHLRLAKIRRLAGRPADAAASLARARDALAADPVDLQSADAWVSIAREARDQALAAADVDAAAAPLLDALDAVRGRGLRVHELDLLLDLAELPADTPARHDHAQAALALATELGFPLDRARAWLALADLHQRHHEPDAAARLVERAAWWVDRIGTPELRARVASRRG